MQLFVDNDILLKLGSANLLQDINKIFGVDNSSIFILPTAIPYFKNNKKLIKKYSREVLDNIIEIIRNYSQIPNDYVDSDTHIILSNIPYIDSGELMLYSIKPLSNEFLILTGDKNSIKTLYSNIQLAKIALRLKHKIACLEYLVIRIMEIENFDFLAKKIIESKFCGDDALKSFFNQQSLTKEKALEGLFSYLNNLNEEIGDNLLII